MEHAEHVLALMPEGTACVTTPRTAFFAPLENPALAGPSNPTNHVLTLQNALLNGICQHQVTLSLRLVEHLRALFATSRGKGAEIGSVQKSRNLAGQILADFVRKHRA